MINPKIQQLPMLIRIPYGTAFVAFAASSLICTQESKPPIVQIGDSHERNQAKPAGQVVRFPEVAKMNLPSFRWLDRPIGRAMMVAAIRMKFANTNAVCNFPIAFDMVEARTPCKRTQHMKTM